MQRTIVTHMAQLLADCTAGSRRAIADSLIKEEVEDGDLQAQMLDALNNPEEYIDDGERYSMKPTEFLDYLAKNRESLDLVLKPVIDALDDKTQGLLDKIDALAEKVKEMAHVDSEVETENEPDAPETPGAEDTQGADAPDVADEETETEETVEDDAATAAKEELVSTLVDYAELTHNQDALDFENIKESKEKYAEELKQKDMAELETMVKDQKSDLRQRLNINIPTEQINNDSQTTSGVSDENNATKLKSKSPWARYAEARRSA